MRTRFPSHARHNIPFFHNELFKSFETEHQHIHRYTSNIQNNMKSLQTCVSQKRQMGQMVDERPKHRRRHQLPGMCFQYDFSYMDAILHVPQTLLSE